MESKSNMLKMLLNVSVIIINYLEIESNIDSNGFAYRVPSQFISFLL